MPVIIGTGVGADTPPGVPLIAYQNVVTTANLTAGSQAVGFPLINVANPATHLAWRSGFAFPATDFIDISPVSAFPTDFVAIAGHNFGSGQIKVQIVDASVSPPVDLSGGFVTVADDSPIIIRFAPAVYSHLRIGFQGLVTVAPQLSVLTAGKILVLERGIKVDVAHVPITFGRKTRVVNGMSEFGNFLGRIVLSEGRETRAEFFGFTPDFYRQQVDAFLSSAQQRPFFWAWAPDAYPLETGYVWLLSDPQPEVSPDHLRIGLTLEMAGLT